MFVRPSILRGQTFNVGRYAQLFQPNPCIQAMRVGTITFYNFVPLSMTLTLAEGHKLSAKQNVLVIFSDTFQLTRMKFDPVLKYVKLNILIPLLCANLMEQGT